jgi:hypothetical protein
MILPVVSPNTTGSSTTLVKVVHVKELWTLNESLAQGYY